MADKWIGSFRDDMWFLSNYSPSKFKINNVEFLNVEQFFAYSKCINEEDQQLILSLSRPSDIKKAGRRIKLRPDWEKIKLDIMYVGVYNKFAQNDNLKKKLLDTGDMLLEERNNWNDTYWGVDYYTGKGQNHLGKILMRVRTELKNE